MVKLKPKRNFIILFSISVSYYFTQLYISNGNIEKGRTHLYKEKEKRYIDKKLIIPSKTEYSTK